MSVREIGFNIKLFFVSSLVIFILLASFSGPVRSDTQITEYILGANSGPYDIALDSSGNWPTIWFTEFLSGKIASLHFTELREYPVPTGGYPRAIAIDHPPLGVAQNIHNVWFTVGGGGASLFQLNPTTGTMTQFLLTTVNTDPDGMVIDSNNNIWITANSVGEGVDKVLKFRASPSPVVESIPIPTLNSVPDDITMDNDGNVWFTEFEGDKIGKIETDGAYYVVKEYMLASLTNPRGIAVDSSGKIWFTEVSGNKIGCLEPSTGTLREYPLPSVYSQPQEIEVVRTPRDIVWFTEYQGNRIGRLDPVSGQICEYTLATPGSHPEHIRGDAYGMLWFTEIGANKIGRLTFSASAVTVASAPTTASSTVVSSTSTVIGSGTTPPVPQTTFTTWQTTSALVSSTTLLDSTYTTSDTVTVVSSLGTTVPSLPGTDWELSDAFTEPASPKPGDTVTFGATLRALWTNGSFPQTVQIEVLGNGIVDSFDVSYPGPIGSAVTIKNTKAYNLAEGNYTVFLIADSPPPYHYSDPNRVNNQVTLSFTITTASTTTTVAPSCLIASAAYGSELSPEVQLLRNFRDRSILKTNAGSNFMMAFNAWYYSFSPYVANYLNQHRVERVVMKDALYPLIGILFLSSHVFAFARTFPEIAVVLAGLLASTLIGTFYLGIPLSLLRASIRRLSGRRMQRLVERCLGVALCVSLFGILVGELLSSSPLLILSTSMSVLTTLFLSAAITSWAIGRQITGFFRRV